MVKMFTVETLYALCKSQMAKGNGKKKILISDDEEGNGYHGLYFGFSPTKTNSKGQDCYDDGKDFFEASDINRPYEVTDENVNDFILLG